MKQQNVRFNDQVRVRNYAVTVGDNPACTIGTPVALDWKIVDDASGTVVSLQQLEEQQEHRYADAIPERKRRRQKHEHAPRGPPIRKLNYYDRQQILKDAGYSQVEIEEGERLANKERRQRAWSTRSTIPVRTVDYVRGSWKKHVQGVGSKRQQKQVVQFWYQHYGDTK